MVFQHRRFILNPLLLSILRKIPSQLHMNLSIVPPYSFSMRWKIEPQRDIARTHQAA
jgi:hypothetical protein